MSQVTEIKWSFTIYYQIDVGAWSGHTVLRRTSMKFNSKSYSTLLEEQIMTTKYYSQAILNSNIKIPTPKKFLKDRDSPAEFLRTFFNFGYFFLYLPFRFYKLPNGSFIVSTGKIHQASVLVFRVMNSDLLELLRYKVLETNTWYLILMYCTFPSSSVEQFICQLYGVSWPQFVKFPYLERTPLYISS